MLLNALVLLAVCWVGYEVRAYRMEARKRWAAQFDEDEADDESPIVRHIGDTVIDGPDWDGQEIPDSGLDDAEWEDRYVGFRAQSQRRKAGNTTVP